MEKRLRRARTAAIVLAVLFYLVSKIGCAWNGMGTTPAFGIPQALLPTTVHIFITFGEVFDHNYADTAVRLMLQLCGLGLSLLSALTAYIVHAHLRVDAD